MYALNNRASKKKKGKIEAKQKEEEIFTIIIRDFNTTLSS